MFRSLHRPAAGRLPALLGSAVTLALVATACGLPGRTADASGAGTDSSREPSVIASSGGSVGPTNPAAPTGSDSATPAASPSAPAGSGPASDQPVATRAGSIDKVKVEATLYPVRRSGDTSTVNLYIAADNPDDTFMLLNSLGDGNTETSSKSLTSVDGVKLVDPVAKRAYLPAVTAQGQCVCAPDDGNTGEPHSSVWVTVTFAAPPTQLNAINVTIPTFGTFTDVPLH